MATRRAIAVLKIGNQADSKAVSTKALTVTNKLTENVAVYTTPSPTVVALNAQILVLQGYMADFNGGNHTIKGLRDEASILLYNMLQEELVYVNHIGNHDRGVLELSGFEVNDEPNPRPIPDRVVIKRIEAGKEPKTVKIIIESLEQTLLTYVVQATTTPNVEDSWKQVLLRGNSRDLVVHDLQPGVEMWFRVSASSANGQGDWSVPVSIFPQR